MPLHIIITHKITPFYWSTSNSKSRWCSVTIYYRAYHTIPSDNTIAYNTVLNHVTPSHLLGRPYSKLKDYCITKNAPNQKRLQSSRPWQQLPVEHSRTSTLMWQFPCNLCQSCLAEPAVQSHDLHECKHGASNCAKQLLMIPTPTELPVVAIDLHIVPNLLSQNHCCDV